MKVMLYAMKRAGLVTSEMLQRLRREEIIKRENELKALEQAEKQKQMDEAVQRAEDIQHLMTVMVLASLLDTHCIGESHGDF